MASRENLNELYKRFLQNECSPEDIRLLTELFGDADNDTLHAIVQKQLNDPFAITPHGSDYSERYDRILNNLRLQLKPEKRVIKLWPKIGVAASIIFLIGIGSYIFLRQPASHPFIARHTQPTEIKPGSDKAYLTLSDGQSIYLTQQRSGIIGNDGGKDIVKSPDEKIEYVDRHGLHNSQNIAFNTLRTPNGGHYKLVLADGTKVWLNAASQLKYPANFRYLKERKIELSGEAYFEVAKDARHPFIVQTDDQQIKVLGTHFNVNAYHDDGGSKTTLLEGSIRAATLKEQALIKPGQQVVSDLNGVLKVQDTDTEFAVAWKNDQFMFESEPVKPLMKSIARWYDVEVIYSKDAPDVRFNGAISKFENISAVLKILEKTGKIHFELSGRKVYVTK
ncbi:FecR family protein [Mucilaginibacter litoreus]|uniref:FecR family protein n=1 Tax=Mucilaginibacter litoreus TaxID=1048221 RepID=A0ABW3ARZ3_9SPHI